MDINHEIAKLKTRTPAFKADEKYRDIACEAEAYYALAYRFRGRERGLPEHRFRIAYQIATYALIESSLALLSAIWEIEAETKETNKWKRQENEIRKRRECFESAKFLYAFVVEKLEIGKVE